jgi:hypothetical protein
MAIRHGLAGQFTKNASKKITFDAVMAVVAEFLGVGAGLRWVHARS